MIARTFSYLTYRIRALSKFGVHSPFVYAFIREVLEDRRQYYAFDDIAALRAELIGSSASIERLDLGAGSRAAFGGSAKRPMQDLDSSAGSASEVDVPVDEAQQRIPTPVSTLARKSTVGADQGAFLFRLVVFLQPANVLELGTCLGLSALYMGSARRSMPLVSIEGCPQTAALARQTLVKGGLKSALVLTGSFEERLDEALEKLGEPGLIFLDGNHLSKPTLAYFERCMEAAGPGTVFLLDDIRWSCDMYRAWRAIAGDPRINLSIDLGRMGLAFLRPEQLEKEAFTLRT